MSTVEKKMLIDVFLTRLSFALFRPHCVENYAVIIILIGAKSMVPYGNSPHSSVQLPK